MLLGSSLRQVGHAVRTNSSRSTMEISFARRPPFILSELKVPSQDSPVSGELLFVNCQKARAPLPCGISVDPQPNLCDSDPEHFRSVLKRFLISAKTSAAVNSLAQKQLAQGQQPIIA